MSEAGCMCREWSEIKHNTLTNNCTQAAVQSWNQGWDWDHWRVPVKPLHLLEGPQDKRVYQVRTRVEPGEGKRANLNTGLLPCLDFGWHEG